MGDAGRLNKLPKGRQQCRPFVFHGAQIMVIAQTYAALRERALIAGDMFQLILELHALRASVKYNADQPRTPAGQPNGGQWVGEGGGGEAAGSTREADMLLAGNLEKLDPSINIGQFVSDNCEGRIRRVLPGQFYDMTIGEMLALRKAGDRAAKICYKLLDRGEYRK